MVQEGLACPPSTLQSPTRSKDPELISGSWGSTRLAPTIGAAYAPGSSPTLTKGDRPGSDLDIRVGSA